MHDVVSDEKECNTIETMRHIIQNSGVAEMVYMCRQLNDVDILPATLVALMKYLHLHFAHYRSQLCLESGSTFSSRLNVIGVSMHAQPSCMMHQTEKIRAL